MKAKEKDPSFRPTRINLTAPNIHIGADTDHLAAFLEKHPEDKPIQAPLKLIFESLRHADELGTLLQIEEPVEKEFRFLKARDDEEKAGPPKQKALFAEMEKPEQAPLPLGVQTYEEWKTGLLDRLSAHFREELASADFSSRFFGETAEKGLSLFDFLSRRYDVVATNPPYMGSKNMGPVVKRYVESHFPSGKRDLYAAFILRCLELARPETGRVAMVTQQSWMFLRSFADLRALDEEKLKKAKGFKGILRETSIETLAHLGPGAFGEISGEVVNIVLFTLAKTPPKTDHRLTAFRLIGPKSPEEKAAHLRNVNGKIVTRPLQSRFLTIPQTPVCYWLRERFFELLAGKTLGDVANVCQGLATANDPRFVRFTWEAPPDQWELPVRNYRWVLFEKGGGYGKWFGHQFWVVDWGHNGARIKAFPGSVIRNEQHYFKEGWTYSDFACGSLGPRRMVNKIFSTQSPGCITEKIGPTGHLLACRTTSLFIRSISAQVNHLRESYVSRLPVVQKIMWFGGCIDLLVLLKEYIASTDITEQSFTATSVKNKLFSDQNALTIATILHSFESWSEKIVIDAYCLDEDDTNAILSETGSPAGWFPLISGYETLPPLPEGLPEVPVEVIDSLKSHERRTLSPDDLNILKLRLHTLYEAGPGAKEEIDDVDNDASDDDEEENDQSAVGARIPIPAETFLEELSQKLEVHPISVYWLLKEGIEKEGWRCLPEEQRLTKDRFTVLILRLLGHRWPKQIEMGEPVPDWADDDGIIPMMEGTEESPLYQRLRSRIAADYGDVQVSAQENVFAEVMGKPLHEWVKKDFFRHHISQFKKRPIAWHLSSAKWTGRPRQDAAFECLVLLPQDGRRFAAQTKKSIRHPADETSGDGTAGTGEHQRKPNSRTERQERLAKLSYPGTEGLRCRLDRCRRLGFWSGTPSTPASPVCRQRRHALPQGAVAEKTEQRDSGRPPCRLAASG
jgi:hypothetical protein